MKKESFIKGTVILIIANTISKILGAILKIPLTYILGEEGMAIYQTAFSVYIMLLSLVISGLPFALSKYISEQTALKNAGNVRFATRISMILMCVLGAFLSFLMYFCADFFALSMKDPKAPFSIRMISPAIFFVAIGAVYKSCYQGRSLQTPTAISQVIEAFVKLLVGYFLASYFSAFSVKYASGAAIFGVTIGEIFATLILFLLYCPYRKELENYPPESNRREILRLILGVAIPMSLTSVISGSLSLLETSVIRNRLTDIIFTDESAKSFLLMYSPFTNVFSDIFSLKALSFDGARWLYGAYSGYAVTVFNLPIGILATFGVAILPIVASSVVLNRTARLHTAITSASKIIFTISLPVSVTIFAFSSQILDILFKNTASDFMLKALAPILPILALDQFVCSVLYSSGKILEPFWYSLLSSLVKIAISYFLIAIPQINIFGAIIASFFAILLQLILSVRVMKKSFGIYPISSPVLIKSLFSSVVFIYLIKSLYTPTLSILGNVFFATIITFLISFLGYVLMLLLFDVIKKDEILHLTKC